MMKKTITILISNFSARIMIINKLWKNKVL